MKPVYTLLILVLACDLTGCRGQSTEPAAEKTPLSVADWQALPVDKKYTSESLERLRRGDPKLQTPEGWDEFQVTILLPARKRDFPKGGKKS